MYLLLGHAVDPCCQLVAETLRAAGHAVWITLDPLAGGQTVAWTLTTHESHGTLRRADGLTIAHEALRGVLVRAPGALVDHDGWAAADLAYVRAEMNAALVAWLRALPCRVLNRPDAELWFRPQRPLAEWRALLERCGLPVLATAITNDPAAARRFAARWNGQVVYAPLTSPTRYPVHDETQWRELDRVMATVPVCLLEPTTSAPFWAVVAGGEVFWSDPAALPAAHRDRFADGLRAVAGLLGLDLLQIELRQAGDGPRCSNLLLFPSLDGFAPATIAALAGELTRLLTA